MSINPDMVRNIVEGALLAAGEPVSFERLLGLFDEDEGVGRGELKAALEALQASMEGRGLDLKEVGSGWRIQVREDLAPWISRLWEQRAPRYTRALLETLAVIAYQQPVTRSDIEQVRGVSVSSNIVKTLLERDWIRILGHRDVPGRPALYGTTRAFLDYFNLRALDELPPLAEIRDLDKINQELGFEGMTAAADEDAEAAVVEAAVEAQDEDEDEQPDGAMQASAYMAGPEPEAEAEAEVIEAWDAEDPGADAADEPSPDAPEDVSEDVSETDRHEDDPEHPTDAR